MEHIFQKHNHWIKLVISFGITDFPEDLVHDCYIRVSEKQIYSEPYFIKSLKNAAMQEHRDKINKVEIIDNIISIPDEVKIDVSDILIFIDTWTWFEKLFYLRYIEEKTSLRKFAIKYHYDYAMVYRTLKKCKLKLKKYGKENN